MSIYTKLIRHAGRVTAVYRLKGVTYVEVRPNCSEIWQAIREQIESLGAVAVRGDI